MAKNDEMKLDAEGLPFIPGFSDAGGVELDLGITFFKPRKVPIHSVIQGFWWQIQEFPNQVNEETGEIMKCGIMKLTKPCVAVQGNLGGDEKLVDKLPGEHVHVPINHKLREIEPLALIQEVCHEIAIVTLEEKPTGNGARTMRGFRYRVVRPNISRAEVERISINPKIAQLMGMGNGAVAPKLTDKASKSATK